MKLFGQAFWIEMWKGFERVFRCFPLSVLCGLGCAVALSVLVDNRIRFESTWQPFLIRSAVTLGFGISVFLLAALISEKAGGLFSRKGWIASSLGLLLLVLFYFWIPLDGDERILDTFWIRMLLLAGFIHLGVAVFPFCCLKEAELSLWEYNKQLFTRFLLAALFSAVFFVGIVLALISIDKLFGADIDEENYGRIWFFCAFVLNTCFFLGGMPGSKDRTRLPLDYPKWIHFFSKFILLPLVIIYFGILYAYTLKIVVSWNWPNGMVGLPVFVLAAIGGLTGLLIWPLGRIEPPTIWARTFWRWFFPLFIPLTILLLFALQRRIADYGFTEIRYLGLLLACWLLAISGFYTLKPDQSFKVVPWSLIGMCLLFAVGPLSPANIASKSQWNRLNAILLQEGLLDGGTLVSKPHDVDSDTFESIRSIINYLRHSYGGEIFSPLLTGIDPSIRQDNNGEDWLEIPHYQFAQELIDFTGIRSVGGIEYTYFSIAADEALPVQIPVAARLHAFQLWGDGEASLGTFDFKGETIPLWKLIDSAQLAFRNDLGDELGRLDLSAWLESLNISELPDSERTNKTLEPEILRFPVEIEGLGTIELNFRQAYFDRVDDHWVLTNLQVWALVPVN